MGRSSGASSPPSPFPQTAFILLPTSSTQRKGSPAPQNATQRLITQALSAFGLEHQTDLAHSFTSPPVPSFVATTDVCLQAAGRLPWTTLALRKRLAESLQDDRHSVQGVLNHRLCSTATTRRSWGPTGKPRTSCLLLSRRSYEEPTYRVIPCALPTPYPFGERTCNANLPSACACQHGCTAVHRRRGPPSSTRGCPRNGSPFPPSPSSLSNCGVSFIQRQGPAEDAIHPRPLRSHGSFGVGSRSRYRIPRDASRIRAGLHPGLHRLRQCSARQHIVAMSARAVRSKRSRMLLLAAGKLK